MITFEEIKERAKSLNLDLNLVAFIIWIVGAATNRGNIPTIDFESIRKALE